MAARSPACLPLGGGPSWPLPTPHRCQAPRHFLVTPRPTTGSGHCEVTVTSAPVSLQPAVTMRAGAESGLSWPLPRAHTEPGLGRVSTHRLSPAASERPLWDASLRAPSCLEAFRDPQFQGPLQHLLRAKASGTVER